MFNSHILGNHESPGRAGDHVDLTSPVVADDVEQHPSQAPARTTSGDEHSFHVNHTPAMVTLHTASIWLWVTTYSRRANPTSWFSG